MFAYLAYRVLIPQDLLWHRAILGATFLSVLIVITFIDMDTLYLPDFLTAGGVYAGLLISAFYPWTIYQIENFQQFPYLFLCVDSFLSSLMGVIVGTGVVYWIRLTSEFIFKREAMGEGDVILAAMVGAFCGWHGAVFAVFGGSVLGVIILIPVMLFKKIERKDEAGALMVPFGPFICLGAAVYWLWAQPYVLAYVDNFVRLLYSFGQ